MGEGGCGAVIEGRDFVNIWVFMALERMIVVH